MFDQVFLEEFPQFKDAQFSDFQTDSEGDKYAEAKAGDLIALKWRFKDGTEEINVSRKSKGSKHMIWSTYSPQGD